MIRSLFARESKTIISAAILLGAASFVSRLLGIWRDRVLAGQFGAGSELDMYYAAFRLPDFLFNIIILGALSAGFIPVFSEVIKNKNKAWQLTSICLNIALVAVIFCAALLAMGAPWILRLITPGFTPEQITTTVQLVRIMLLGTIFLSVSGIFGSVLQSYKHFFFYSIAPIFYNLGIIIGAIFLSPGFGITGVAWGVTLGAFLHMLLQVIPAMAMGYRYSFEYDIYNKHFVRIIRLMGPRVLGLMVSQVNFFVITIIGSTLAAGSIAIFNLANNIQAFPLGLFAISFAVAAFPTLSELADKKKQFVQTLSLTMRQILFLIIPASALLIVLRAQVVRAILGAGLFDWEDTLLTLNTLSFFAISLFAQSLILIVARAFYALEDSKTPFYSGFVAAIANVILALLLVDSFGVLGLALAFSLATILNLALLLLSLRARLGDIDGTRILISFGKILVATFMLAIVAQAIKYPVVQVTGGVETLGGIVIQAAAAGTGGIAAYLLLCWFLKVEELTQFIESFKRKLLKKQQLPAEALDPETLS